MSILKNPKEFLRKSIMLTCAAAVLSQAVAPLAQAAEQISTPATISIELGDQENVRAFDTQSLGGESVLYFNSGSQKIIDASPGMDEGGPAASLMGSNVGEVVCAVNENMGMVGNLGNRVIQIDSVKTGAIVDGSLTRLATAAHEYGHCLDMLANKSISQAVQNAGISVYDVPALAIANAVADHTGVMNFSTAVDENGAIARSAVDLESDYRDIGLSVLEVYADLQGALQSATVTGDLRGFTEFEMAIRLNNLGSMDHTSALSVAKILTAEQANGFDPKTLQGQSFDSVNTLVNDMFTRHFTVDGQYSIHSEGFKDIVREIQIKQALGVDIGNDNANVLNAITDQSDIGPSAADKALYVGMMFKNQQNQAELVSNANPDRVGENVTQMLESLKEKALQAQITLGVDAPQIDDNLFAKQSVDSGDLNAAAGDFLQKATSIKTTSLDNSGFKLSELIKDVNKDKRVVSGLEP